MTIKTIYFEDLFLGQNASFGKTVTETDIIMFAGISGDTNPLHMNEEYAKTTLFKGRIAHGLLSAGFISAVLGTHLPGPGAVYLKQSFAFKAPVRIGDTVVAKVTVKELFPEKKRALFETICTVNGETVIDGDALILIPGRPDSNDEA